MAKKSVPARSSVSTRTSRTATVMPPGLLHPVLDEEARGLLAAYPDGRATTDGLPGTIGVIRTPLDLQLTAGHGDHETGSRIVGVVPGRIGEMDRPDQDFAPGGLVDVDQEDATVSQWVTLPHVYLSFSAELRTLDNIIYLKYCQIYQDEKIVKKPLIKEDNQEFIHPLRPNSAT